ncbi:hypothetical protein [Lysinibacillus xylanilyticus]|uniref:hypothetical protein n=1 Tax=Lysinibacillus xylanilyticus TaxID=582475 RepID=UPI003803ECE2
MEKLVLLMYGDSLPPRKHIHKIADKYIRYFLNEMKNESLNEDEYCKIRIEERYIGLGTRSYGFPPIVPIKYEYLTKFINIFKSLNCNICLCTESHEHPTSYIGGFAYEGYCYYMKDEEKKILFLEDYGVENAGIELGVLYEKVLNDPTFNVNLLDEDDFDGLYEKITNNPTFLDVFNDVFNSIPKNERYSIDDQEWYKTLPIEKRFKIIDINIETEIVFDQWLKEIV